MKRPDMKIGILGGGFGLYGYLPALSAMSGIEVNLPVRYQNIIKTRSDINYLYDRINWFEDDNALLEASQGIVIATPPIQQNEIAKNCLKHRNITHMFLEKPLASSPLLSEELLTALINSKKQFRLGYNFRLTDWGQSLLNHGAGIDSITWKFKAHHYAHQLHTWKREHAQGGGALRFYGIHIIALLAELGYQDVLKSNLSLQDENEVGAWTAEFVGLNLTPCKIIVNSNCNETQFLVAHGDGFSTYRLHPFESLLTTNEKVQDQRIPVLISGLNDLLCSKQQYLDWYVSANTLWKNIEKRTLEA